MTKLVLFDIDGTLIVSSEVHSQAFSEAFMKVFGVNTTIDIINHHGMTDQEIIIEVLKKTGSDDATIRSRFRDCITALVESFNELVTRDNVVVLDGVRRLLEELHKHEILIGLVTGNLEPIARSKLKLCGLNRYFSCGGFGSDGMNRKELVTLAIRRAKENFAFEFDYNVFLFGDTPKDIRAGKESGVKTVAVATGIYARRQLEEAGPDFVLENLKNTKDIMKIIL